MLAYLKMLAIDRIAGWKPSSHGKPGEGRAKTVFKYVGFTFLALYLYAVVLLLEYLVYETGAQMGEPQLMIAVVLLGCTLITLLYSFFYVVSLLFFGRDTTFLAALPISSHSILTAKLIMVAAGEIGLTFLVGAPMLIRYGIESGANALYYVRSLVGMLFVPLVPIAISTLLACLLIRVSALWKRRESMTIVISFAFMAALIAFQMSINMNMNESDMSGMVMKLLFNQGSMTDIVLKNYPPMRWLVDGITGSGWAAWSNTLLFALASLGAVALMVLIFGRSYLRLALKQQESIRRENVVRRRLGADKARKPFWALFRQEMREVITVPVYATNCLASCVMFPVMIVFMMIGFKDRLPGAELSSLFTQLVPAEYMLMILTAALGLTATMSMAASTAVSREGKRHDMRKTYPVSGFVQLGAKLAMGMCYNFVTTLFSAIALWVLLPSLWMQTLVALALSQLISLLFTAIGLIWDAYHAKLQWKTETEAVKQNFNSFLSMLIAFGVLAAMVGLFLLGLHIKLTATLAFALVMALTVALDVLLLKWMRGKASVAYFLR